MKKIVMINVELIFGKKQNKGNIERLYPSAYPVLQWLAKSHELILFVDLAKGDKYIRETYQNFYYLCGGALRKTVLKNVVVTARPELIRADVFIDTEAKRATKEAVWQHYVVSNPKKTVMLWQQVPNEISQVRGSQIAQPTRKRTGVDMDETLFHFRERVINELPDFIQHPERFTGYYLEPNYPDEMSNLILHRINRQGFFAQLRLIEHARKNLQTLKNIGHELIICSAPMFTNPHCIPEKMFSLAQNELKQFFSGYVFTGRKDLLIADHLIDDKWNLNKKMPQAIWQQILFLNVHCPRSCYEGVKEERYYEILRGWNDTKKIIKTTA